MILKFPNEIIIILLCLIIIFMLFFRRCNSLSKSANFDILTGVHNRNYFEKNFKKIIRVSFHEPISLLFVDIDHFKKINDNYGHHRGDEILTSLAGMIRVNLRKNDIVARYGGEEFVVLLPDLGIKEAKDVAERLQIGSRHIGKNFGIPLTLSIGVVSYPELSSTKQDLVKKADQAMYQAKKQGRNQIVIYNSDEEAKTSCS